MHSICQHRAHRQSVVWTADRISLELSLMPSPAAAAGILFSGSPWETECVRAWSYAESALPVTQYLTNHLWEFQPSYNFGAVWDKEKLIAHVEVKGQGHGETICRILWRGAKWNQVKSNKHFWWNFLAYFRNTGKYCNETFMIILFYLFLFVLIRSMRFERLS